MVLVSFSHELEGEEDDDVHVRTYICVLEGRYFHDVGFQNHCHGVLVHPNIVRTIVDY